MMTAGFVSGASLFALLIVDICCLPVNKGYYPDASYGSSYKNTAPNFDYQGVPSGQFPPGAVGPYNAPSHGISTPSYHAVPQPGPSVPQPTVQRGPAPSVGSPGPVFSGDRGTAMRPNSASSAQPGAAFQSGQQDWAVSPLTLVPEYVSPPAPLYQAGELSHYEKSFEHSNSERETEELGRLPPPPPPPVFVQESARQGYPIQPQPNFFIGGWGPYPYYDFRFLTGQYPPGTITHSSSSYEQGRDHWQDVHYVRDYAPYNADDFVEPEVLEDPATGSGEGDAQAGSGEGDAQAGSGQGDAQAGSGQGGAKGGTQAGSGQGGAKGGTQAGSGQGGAKGGTQAGSGQGNAQAGSGQGGAKGGTQAGSGQGSAWAGYRQGGAQAGYGQGGAWAGSGQGGAHYGQGSAQAGYGHGGAQAGLPASLYGGIWQPVNPQAGGYNLGKVGY